VLAPAAAGSVLEVGGTVHRLSDLCFFLLGKVFVCVLVLVRPRLAG
jgi:hypothetical protein